MLVPTCLLGNQSEVRNGCRRIIREILKGAPLADSLCAAGVTNFEDHSNIIVLDGPALAISGGTHFHMWAPIYEVARAGRNTPVFAASEMFRDWAAEMPSAPWMFLLFMSQHAYVFLKGRVGIEAFAKSVIANLDEVASLGSRFSLGGQQPASILSLPTNVIFVGGRFGYTSEEMRAWTDVSTVVKAYEIGLASMC